jgi:hypothetical protein
LNSRNRQPNSAAASATKTQKIETPFPAPADERKERRRRRPRELDALDGDVREILTGDVLDLAVGVAETNELGESAGLAGRREPVETIALAADDEPLEAEQGVCGRTGGGMVLGRCSPVVV